MFERIVANLTGDYRREELEGRPHLVVPCVMIVEGVLNGSQGSYYYPAEENGKDPAAWDHMPIVVYHPTVNGEFVSARQQTFLNTRKVGIVLNTKHETNKLKTEAWFDEERTKEVDIRVYNSIIDKKQMEVSTGLGFEAEMKEGEFDGVKYKGIARNHKPDHLAVLPDKIGACSIKRGAGLYANAATEPDSVQLVLSRSVENALARIQVDLASNVLSFSQTSRMLADALGAKYGEKGKYWEGYIYDCFPTFVIFSDGKGKRWMQKYTATDTSVSLNSDPVEIMQTVEWKTVTGKALTLNSVNELVEVSVPVTKETEMAFDKKVHVSGLIGNGFEETDRTWLEALPDAQLQKILPKAKEVVPTPTPVVSPPVVPFAANTAPAVTLAQLVANADPATQAVFADMQASHAKEKTSLIAKIKGCATNQFPDDALNNMALPNLRAIAALVPDPNMSANGLPYDLSQMIPGVGNGPFAGAVGYIPQVGNNEELEDPPLPPEMTFSKERE